MIALYDTTKLASIQSRYYWKATAYHYLGIEDSVKFYGQLYLDSTDFSTNTIKILGLLGNKEKALNLLREGFKLAGAEDSDIWTYCNRIIIWEIDLLSQLGDYEEATDLLLNINRSYPNYGAYALLYNLPNFDKIKSEYPPFVDALNNLKLPQKLDLEGLVKL